jgi:type IV pilus assembly protein PilA
MLKTIKQRLGRDDEQGFTLIELMVVLLIIAILLAIAIPTFLGARNTANARSTQSNLRNALTAEQTTWTNSQSFDSALGGIEPSLTWQTALPAQGTNQVDVKLVAETVTGGAITAWGTGTATTSDGVLLMGYAKDGNCYAIYQSNNAGADFTAYDQFTGPCAVPGTLPASAATGSAGSNPGTWSATF